MLIVVEWKFAFLMINEFSLIIFILSEFIFDVYRKVLHEERSDAFTLFCVSSSLVKIFFYDNAGPHIARMTTPGQMSLGWQCSATYCQDDNARPNIAKKTMLGCMSPGWQCSATYCQDDTAEAYWVVICDFATSHKFFWLLTLRLTFFSITWGSRIHRLHLCRGVRPPNECPGMALNNLRVRI